MAFGMDLSSMVVTALGFLNRTMRLRRVSVCLYLLLRAAVENLE